MDLILEGILNADPDEAEIQSNSASSLDINPYI